MQGKLSFCNKNVRVGSFLKLIPEHVDPSWIKRVKNKQIPEYADPLYCLYSTLSFNKFRSMLTPLKNGLFYICDSTENLIIENKYTMAGKTSSMSVIKEVLREYKKGIGKKRIASNVGISRNTVKRYIDMAEKDPLPLAKLISLDGPVLEQRFNPGNPAYKDERYERFKELVPYYLGELNNPHVTKTLLWNEYIEQEPSGYKYSQFCYHLQQAMLKKPNVVTVLTDKFVPGEKIFLDFAGDKLSYIDRATGEIIEVNVFVACLPYSDYTYALAVPTQSQEDFAFALMSCFNSLGGVPKIIVIDNLKAGVITASCGHTPKLNELFSQIAIHYDAVVIPTYPRKPKHKAKVENIVSIIYNRVYARMRHQVFYSLNEINEAIGKYTQQHNQTRMQQRGYSREELFLSKERESLKPLPGNNFEIKYMAKLKVQENCHVYLRKDQCYYSVPYQYIGKKVTVEYTRTILKTYLNGNMLSSHLRSPGWKYKTKDEHLASNSLAYLSRSPQKYIEKGFKKSPLLGNLFEKIFEETNSPPEYWYCRCNELLAIDKDKDVESYNFALNTALRFSIFSPKRIKNLLFHAKNKQDVLSEYQEEIQYKDEENLRGSGYFK
ncbi:MAG: IS21 family transposase [Kiritimatiellae bacterium]|jgi:transposase|nr:IS21 family transposase [Kiritimatiellia bacterium]